MLLVALAQTPQDFNRVLDRRFADIHRLEATFEGGITLDVLSILIQSGCSDALELSPGKSRFENVCCIDGTFSGTCTDQGVHLIDHEDHIACGLDLLHDLFEAFLELTAVFGACDQKTDVQRENALLFKNVRNITLLNPLCEPFSDGGFADTGLTDQHGIVLGASTKDLDHAVDFVVATHNRIEFRLTGELGQVASELVECGGLGGSLGTGASAASCTHLCGFTQHPDHLGAHLG